MLPLIGIMFPTWLVSSVCGACVGYGAFAWCNPRDPDHNPVYCSPSPTDFHDLLPLQGSRGERRAKARAMKKQRVGPRSIHAFGLSKHYPRNLRSEGTYITAAWSAEERRKYPGWHRCVRQMHKGKADCPPNCRPQRHWLNQSKFCHPKLKQWSSNCKWRTDVKSRNRRSKSDGSPRESTRPWSSNDPEMMDATA